MDEISTSIAEAKVSETANKFQYNKQASFMVYYKLYIGEHHTKKKQNKIKTKQ